MAGQQVAVVTGATAGVGRAVTRALAEQGWAVGLLARGDDGLEATAKDVEALGGRPLAVPTDVADPAAVQAAAEQVERELGPVDVWVNNAMTSVFGRFWDVEADEFTRTTEVVYLGVVNGTRAALDRMIPRGRGQIVQIGSALAYRGIPLQSAYCGSKHAIVGFTESLRTELMHEGIDIHVGMVHLPAMNTPQFGWVRSRLPHKAQPVPPIYQPEVAAKAVLAMIERPRRQIWVAYPTVLTILGNKVAPGLLDRYLARNGVESQQTDEPEEERSDNLFSPVPGDHGAHGGFDERARAVSPALELWLRGRQIAAGAGAVAVAAAGMALARRHDR